jgi:hypothetical protein
MSNQKILDAMQYYIKNQLNNDKPIKDYNRSTSVKARIDFIGNMKIEIF